MAAYAIGSMTVNNTDWQKEYGEKMPALIQRHGGRVLARAPATQLEGSAALPTVVVMIEFPSTAQAQAWYDDPEHQPLKQLRRTGASLEMLLVNGL